MFHRLLSASAMISGLLLAGTSRAESPRFHGAALAAHAVSGHQERELGFGAAGLLAAELPLVTGLGIQAELGEIWLSEGRAPEDPRVKPGGAATSLHAAVGARFHPTGPIGGPWLAAAGGAARTGGLTRPLFDIGAGFDFVVSEHVGVGPSVGVVHVFQGDGEFRPADANVLLAGVHVVFDPGGEKTDGDRDNDGIRDSLDRCPDDPEDEDGFEDSDGCPDNDNDQDGVLDAMDKCPLVAEDRDGFEDADGCPDSDNDHDGIADARDKCPNQPEDRDGFEDTDGCPDPDNDQDGILDVADLCPNEPETKNGYADEDGCPDTEQVRVVGDKIVLDDRIHFATNSSQIRPTSYPLLERVADLILANPSYVHIQVEGHTDERGPDWFNQKLSQGRAESVLEFLIKHGIDQSRMSAKGYGKSKPLASNKSEHAWFINRRVEFAITREVRK